MFANTQRQILPEHLFAVGYLNRHIIETLDINDDYKEKLKTLSYYVGCLHDIGKLDSLYQKWVQSTSGVILNCDLVYLQEGKGKFSFEKHPRHNEISIYLYHLLIDDAEVPRIFSNRSLKSSAFHSILWHHPKIIREKEFTNYGYIHKKLVKVSYFDKLASQFHQTISEINNIAKSYNPSLILEGFVDGFDDVKISDVDSLLLPSYKEYRDCDDISEVVGHVKKNAINNIVRSSLITADRIISSLTADELHNHIVNKTLHTLYGEKRSTTLLPEIKKCLDGFEKRFPNSPKNISQAKAALELSQNPDTVNVLRGPAGCGKTKSTLEVIYNLKAQWSIWACPRLDVCDGIFEELISKDYLPNSKIELITGSSRKTFENGVTTQTLPENLFTGDIIVTNIDYLVSSVITHFNVSAFTKLLTSFVVFDEFHEHVNHAGLDLFFGEMIQAKKYLNNPATLLVSATPNKVFVDEFLELDTIVKMKSYNDSDYEIALTHDNEDLLDENNPRNLTYDRNTFIISEIALDTQQSFILNQKTENGLLVHGGLRRDDKEIILAKLFKSFGVNGDKSYDIVRCTMIIQASLNISCDNMLSTLSTIENFFQRLGRLDRFSLNDLINLFTLLIPTDLSKSRNGSFLQKMKTYKSSMAWLTFLKTKPLNTTVTINELYDWYDEFYNTPAHYNEVAKDMLAKYNESIRLVNKKVLDPRTKSKNVIEDDVLRIQRNSLRGDSVFTGQAVRNIGNGLPEFPDEYIEHDDITLTKQTDLVKGHGKSERNLLSFASEKQHRLLDWLDNVKDKPYQDVHMIYGAKSSEYPIYLSFTPKDLGKINAQQHLYAQHYVIGKNQPIGTMCNFDLIDLIDRDKK